MKREISVHLVLLFLFLAIVAIFRHFFNLDSWPFWIGTIIGNFLPDLDHIIYLLFLEPQDLTAQRTDFLVNKREFRRAIELLYETRAERKNLIFHTILFQIIMIILTFWMMSSSASVFGKGLSLAFLIHLCVDQLVDLFDTKSLSSWFNFLPFKFEFNQSKLYLILVFIAVCIIGFLV